MRPIIKNADLARSPESNLELFTACRRELARRVIEPALRAGRWIVSDRNWLSSLAIQGFGEGLSVQTIVERSQEALGDQFMPDYTIIIDAPVEVVAARLLGRGPRANDLFRASGQDHFEKLRSGYLWAATEYNIPFVDGTQSPEVVHSQIMQHLGALMLDPA